MFVCVLRCTNYYSLLKFYTTHTQALIIANTSGEVSLFSVNTLQPLLNNSLEETVRGFSVTPAYSDQFFILDVSYYVTVGDNSEA